MPVIDSILYERGSGKETANSHGCCEFLHSEQEHYNALVPMKYFLNYKESTNVFVEWLKFLKNELEIDLKWELIENYKVRGCLTYSDYLKMLEWATEDYITVKSIKKSVKHIGVRSRSSSTLTMTSPLTMFVYGSGLAVQARAIKGVWNLLFKDSRIKSYEIPMMDIQMPIVTDPALNSMKFWNWALIRFYACYQQLCNFILDEKETLNKLRKQYNLEWYNMLFIMSSIFRLESTFSYCIKKPIRLKDIEDTLREAYNKQDQGYNEDDFDEDGYDEDGIHIDEYEVSDSIYFDNILNRHETKFPPGFKSVGYSTWVTDTVHGRFTKENSTEAMSLITNFIKGI